MLSERCRACYSCLEMTSPEKPADWNDHDAWDRYHAFLLTQPRSADDRIRIGSIPLDELPGLAQSLKSRNARSIWIPGCGISPLPALLSHLGLDVVATDVSPAAIAHQNRAMEQVPPIGFPASKDPEGSLVAEVHDFRHAYRADAFDLIINVKAFQGFPRPDIEAIAQVHFSSCRPGSESYFDTMNVQGEHRDFLEQMLVDAGFVVPLYSLNREYRKALRSTGLPHLFILGSPMIPLAGIYAKDRSKWDHDIGLLRAIASEFEGRMQSEYEAESLRTPKSAKIARMIYSTG